MDILTQGLVGAAMAQTIANRQETRRAALVGLVAGLAADADILIDSSQDPLLTLEYHRHFTHSIFFIPFGAVIVMLLLWPFMRQHLRPARLYLYCLMGFSLSGVIDAFTSYGTHLFWPLSNERVAWSLISIIDPIFTGILLVSLIVALIRLQPKSAQIGMLLCAGYLVIGFVQHERAAKAGRELAAQRGHVIEEQRVKPGFANLVLWRSIYISEGKIYVDAVRLTGQVSVYAGDSIPLLQPRDVDAIAPPGSVLNQDIKRFAYFSDNFIAFIPGRDNAIADIRYSMLPTSLEPLWGIEFDRTQPDKHAQFVTYRRTTPEIRSAFMNMLTGKTQAQEQP